MEPFDLDKAVQRLMKRMTGRSACNVGFAPFTIRREWDKDEAAAFHVWLCKHDDHEPKPVVWNITAWRRVGQHCEDKIRMNPALSAFKRWEVFLHELAHYKVKTHRSAFVKELVRVYHLWREWSREVKMETDRQQKTLAR